jgi:ribonuclease HII
LSPAPRAGARARGRLERRLLAEGLDVAGVDEVGRGCLAGPVYAACAVLDFARVARLKPALRGLLRDSKQLTRDQRAAMVPVIHDVAVEWQIASAGVDEIERHGILAATFAAMRRALGLLGARFDILLIDGKLPLAHYPGRQQPVVRGDDLCYTIAAASILAKEARDAFMRDQAGRFPAYGFEAHVGYGTARHLAMIERHGICRLHRRNFEPVRVHAPDAALGTPEFK